MVKISRLDLMSLDFPLRQRACSTLLSLQRISCHRHRTEFENLYLSSHFVSWIRAFTRAASAPLFSTKPQSSICFRFILLPQAIFHHRVVSLDSPALRNASYSTSSSVTTPASIPALPLTTTPSITGDSACCFLVFCVPTFPSSHDPLSSNGCRFLQRRSRRHHLASPVGPQNFNHAVSNWSKRWELSMF